MTAAKMVDFKQNGKHKAGTRKSRNPATNNVRFGCRIVEKHRQESDASKCGVKLYGERLEDEDTCGSELDLTEVPFNTR